MVKGESEDQAGYHVLPEADFDEIARGDGDPPAVGRLIAAEYSRRLALLRVLLELATDRPELLGPLAPAEDVWRDLDRLQSDPASAAMLREVLLHPQFGVWLSYVIRAIKRSTLTTAWPAVGQIHCATFAATVRSGGRCVTALPVWQGYVLLPTLGLARFPRLPDSAIITAMTGDGKTVLRADGHDVILPADPARDAEGWWGLRRLEARSDGRSLSVSLDDVDPFRDLADPVAPQRLSSSSVNRWSELLDEAWRILNSFVPETAEAISAGLTSLAPLPDSDDGSTRSASTGDGFGAVLLTRPPDALSMAESLVHEFQHTKLGSVLHLLDLIDDDGAPRHYAPWRDDIRPLAGLFQGVYAYLGITAFWRSRCHSEGADPADEFEYAYARRQTWNGLYTVWHSGGLSTLGERFLAGMTSRLRPWMSEPLSARALRDSWYAAADHRIGWRIRNLEPDAVRVDELAEKWLKATLEATPQLPPAGLAAKPWSQRRLRLLRVRANTPRRFHDLHAVGRHDADLALIGGDTAAALRSYRSRLHRNVEDDDAWAGLALACVDSGPDLPWRPLLRRAELVKAVCRRLFQRNVRADPIDIAALCERDYL